ncbi:hypothetical protein [Rugamonas sp.]|uniref:hypothetical protein n=1 Tax=Rugamonas sp. TaxID=1926287 RepID=UPI0025F26A10|nr:hypothetical protein [Rugamonas sp.]
MSTCTITELKAKRDALDKRIANHQPLAHSAAVNKVCAFATERGMTEDDLFPAPIDPDADPYAFIEDESGRDPEYEPFPEFIYQDTFGYTFMADLKEQHDKLDAELQAIQHEAIERVRTFISEYKLTKEDIYRMTCLAK